jgi:two-component system response regulator GlrR
MSAAKHILIVDDEAVIRELLTEVLTMAGYRVSPAATAAAAKQLLLADRPDLMVTDLQLEQSDGLALLAEIKAAHPDMPTLLLTGVLFDEETVEARLRGKVSAYLPKTSPLKVIVAEVGHLLRSL